MDELETIINDKNLYDNNFEHVGFFADFKIFNRDNQTLLLESIDGLTGHYKIHSNYLRDTLGSLTKGKLYEGIQLDLFENSNYRGD